jgi:hypothetical protein
MRRLVFLIISTSLFLVGFAWKGGVATVQASPDIYQGDLILTGNNVTTIEGRFDINGSIIVRDNATLYLKDALLSFTQTTSRQHNMTLVNPSNGFPHFLADNSTVTSNQDLLIKLEQNSSAVIRNSTIYRNTVAYDDSTVFLSDSSFVEHLATCDSAILEVYDSMGMDWHTYDSTVSEIHDSVISNIVIGPSSVNCTISELEPGYFGFWDFVTNSSVSILPGGKTPNVRMSNTTVSNWRFAFYGDCHAIILNSTLSEVSPLTGSSVIDMKSSSVAFSALQVDCQLLAEDSTIGYLHCTDNSQVWATNSTLSSLPEILSQSRVYVGWHLDAHVIDSIGQDVLHAAVITYYEAEQGVVVVARTTNESGWARLTLWEKMMNASGSHLFDEYRVQVVYEIFADDVIVNMTGNKQITLTLDGLVIPEFPSTAILLLVFIFAALASILVRREHVTHKRTLASVEDSYKSARVLIHTDKQ